MSTRAIVTSRPVVSCDVCGRSLLRGESPDTFLAGGQPRTVCELCTPRATSEGWLRDDGNHSATALPGRPRRGGSLLGRLRQLREPTQRPVRRDQRPAPALPDGLGEDLTEDGIYEFIGGGEEDPAAPLSQEPSSGSFQYGDRVVGHDEHDDDREELAGQEEVGAEAPSNGLVGAPAHTLARAIAVFNASDPPRRVAGVARSLGAPAVCARSLDGLEHKVTIVVAWELCWYRYEVDLADEDAGARLVAQGMELDELGPEDRLANLVADERGELVLPAA